MSLVEKDDLKFLFMLSLFNSGTTAAARVLCSSDSVVGINEMCEGAKEIKYLFRKNKGWIRDRFDPDIKYGDIGVKKTWLNIIDKKIDHNTKVIFDKSPPNVLRAKELSIMFDNSEFIIFTRNPYAFIASCRKRYSKDMNKYLKGGNSRLLEWYANRWVQFSKELIRLKGELDISLCIRYEDFCSDPRSVADKIKVLMPEVGELDVNIKMKIKNYPLQKLSNKNNEQIRLLSNGDLRVINNILRESRRELRYFNYKIINKKNRDEYEG